MLLGFRSSHKAVGVRVIDIEESGLAPIHFNSLKGKLIRSNTTRRARALVDSLAAEVIGGKLPWIMMTSRVSW